MFLALKELKKEKGRFIMILLLIVLIAYLVYFLSSLAFGLARLNKTAVEHLNVEGIVLSRSSNNNIYASSIDDEILRHYPEDKVRSLSVINTNVYRNNDQETLLNLVFFSYDLKNPITLPRLIEGREVKEDFELVVSTNIRDKEELVLGDRIYLADVDRYFEIVGFTEASNFNTIPVAYVSETLMNQAMMQYNPQNEDTDAQSAATSQMPKRFSAMLIKEEDFNQDYRDLLDQDQLMYLSNKEFIDTIPGYQAQVLTFGLMIVSLSLIAAIILGIFMYILTMQKKPIFAILKIQGYENSFIIKSIIVQITLLLLVGLSVAYGLTLLTMLVLPAAVPVALNFTLLTGVSIFIIVISLLGAFFSAKTVLSIDPLEAL